MVSGLVSNIQKYAIHDGPGIRTEVFLKGCPLSCAWCHNPENLSPKPEVVVFEARCVRCGQCFKVCPKSSLVAQEVDELASQSSDSPFNTTGPRPAVQCSLCGACIEACPTGARQLLGKQMSVDEVLAEIEADRIFYDESGGGVTLSGGEPLMQFEFLMALLQACQCNGIQTAVDTCGFAPWERLLAIARVTDLFLYDLKFIDDDKHKDFTGVSNKLILDNLQSLGRVHDNIWVRIPVIPSVNDSADQLDAMARFAASVPGVRQVNLLPYHKTGIHKFNRLGKPYQLANITPPSAEYMEAVVSRFTACGLTAKAGG